LWRRVSEVDRRGQFRIIEALVTAVLVVGSMMIAVGIQRMPRFWITYETEDLEDMAFNMLAEIADQALLSRLLDSKGSWETDLFWTLNTMLPPTIYFNMSIYKMSLSSGGNISLEALNRAPITNIQQENADRIAESASATYVFTSPDGTVYLAALTLARSRGG